MGFGFFHALVAYPWVKLKLDASLLIHFVPRAKIFAISDFSQSAENSQVFVMNRFIVRESELV